MNKKIRQGIFETNSSSSHSIAIAGGQGAMDSMRMQDGVVVVETGEFGWEVEDYHDADTKAAYCLTWLLQYGKNKKELKHMLMSVIKEVTGAEKVVLNIKPEDSDSWNPNGYIDHQSMDVCDDAFVSEDTLKKFIFYKDSVLKIDNDNH